MKTKRGYNKKGKMSKIKIRKNKKRGIEERNNAKLAEKNDRCLQKLSKNPKIEKRRD